MITIGVTRPAKPADAAQTQMAATVGDTEIVHR